MAVLSWLITGLVAVLLATFAVYVYGLRYLPTECRPRTPTYDRLGVMIGLRENPDYRENPEQDPAES